jgi:gamma-glutamyl-gamma-aminobutyrate hydrolase PuuD
MKRVAVTYSNEKKVPPYADALRLAGVDPLLVSPANAIVSLDGVDGLMLSGGTDLNPSLYGQNLDPQSEHSDDERDALELRLLREALERDLPVLAICRGLQLFNIAHSGGSLVQHIDGHAVRGGDPSLPAHTVRVEPGTILEQILGPGEHPVNSRHHQAAAAVGSGLRLSAFAPDGTIEGLERPDRRFAVAVQWHPEDQVRAFPEQLRLFQAFAAAL